MRLAPGTTAGPAHTKVTEGQAKKSRSSALQAELEPFVEPDLCLARVIAND